MTPRRARWALFVLLLITGITYARAVAGDFIWDDDALIVHNRYVSSWRYVPRALTHHFWDVPLAEKRWSQRHYFRPAVTLSYLVDYQLWGGARAAGFHLTNLLLHLGVVLLAWLVCRRLAPERLLVALIGAGIFALHPTRAESVIWISGRTDILLALFFLAAILLYDRALATRGWRFVLLTLAGGVAYAAALGSKETAVALAVVLPGLDILLARSEIALRRRNWSFVHGPVILGTLLFLGAIAAREESLGAAGGIIDRLVTILATAGHYAALLVNPYHPNILLGAYYDPRSPGWSFVTLGALALIVTLVGLALTWRRTPRIAWALLLTSATLAPALNLVPLPQTTLFAERFTYLPLFGLTLALGVTLTSEKLTAAFRRIVLLTLGILALTWAVVIVLRAGDFHDRLHFWNITAKENPDHPLAEKMLARQLARRGDFAAAARAFALAEGHARGRGLSDLANALLFERLKLRVDRLADADRDELTRLARLTLALAKRRSPALPLTLPTPPPITITTARGRALADHFRDALYSLAGRLLSRLGDDRHALEALEQAVRLQPKAMPPQLHLAIAQGRARKLDAALATLTAALRRYPNARPAIALRAKLRAFAGRRHALRRHDEAPSPRARHLLHAELLFALDAPGRAATILARLHAEAPQDRSLISKLVLTLAASGAWTQAAKLLEETRHRFGAERGLVDLARRARQTYLRLRQRLGRPLPPKSSPSR